jgi:glycosyltransferase involved in cell wall biosynthesis
MSSQPIVTVIVIFLNAGEVFFREAIESVFAQTYDNWELLLVDDGSTDISTEIAKQYSDKYPDKLRYLDCEGHQNRGTGAARNLGIQHANGEYIAFLDADDLWLPEKLANQVAILNDLPEVGMVYNSTLMWYGWTNEPEDIKLDRDRGLGVDPDRIFQPPELLTLFIAREIPPPSTCSVLIRREVIRSIGGCEASFRGLFEDQVLFAKICAMTPVFVASGCWDRYRQHPNSICHTSQGRGKDGKLQPDAAHHDFLNWLEGYLLTRGMQSTAAWRALQRGLDPYRKPIRYRLATTARYWRKICLQLIRANRFKPYSTAN